MPFFYGWGIVAAATIGIVMSIPGQTMGVSVFTDPLLAATQLSRLELAATYLIGTLISSLLLPYGGSLLDRYGARIAAMGAALAMGLTLLGFMHIGDASQALTGLTAAPGSTWPAAVLLTVGFALLRFSGQGMLTMSSRTMAAKWFDRRRGLAAGVSSVFVSFGFAAAPLGLHSLISMGDWHSAYLWLAALVGVGMTLIAWAFYRDNPEECGLRMDGEPARDSPIASDGLEFADSTAIDPDPATTRGEALRAPAFWSVTLALAIQSMVYTGVTFHIVDLGREAGIGGTRAVEFFLPIAAVSTVFALLSGWAADNVEIRSLVVVFLAAQTFGFVGAGRLGEPLFAALMIGGWGAASGLFGTIATVAIPKLFGRTHLGAIVSVQMSFMVAASAVGPALLAVAKDFIGSYRQGLLLCCVLSGAAMVFALLTRTPHAARRGG